MQERKPWLLICLFWALIVFGCTMSLRSAEGGWGSGGCGGFGCYAPTMGPVGPGFGFHPGFAFQQPAYFFPTPTQQPPAPAPAYTWVFDGDQYNLMQGSIQVGAYDGKHYLARTRTGWKSKPSSPPILPPATVSIKHDCGCGGLGGCQCGPNCPCSGANVRR